MTDSALRNIPDQVLLAVEDSRSAPEGDGAVDADVGDKFEP